MIVFIVNLFLKDKKRTKQSVIKSSDVSKGKASKVEGMISRKKEVLQLIREVSKRVDFKENKQRFGNLSDFFKCVVVDKKMTPFFSCNLCIGSSNNRLLMSSQYSQLKSHLMSNRHKGDKLVNDFFAKEGNPSEEAFGSDGKPSKGKRGIL